jgi:hypothetical protein
MSARNRSRLLVSAVALLFVGLVGVWGMGASAFERYRPVDMLRLLAAGACFGAALTVTVEYFRGRRRGGV